MFYCICPLFDLVGPFLFISVSISFDYSLRWISWLFQWFFVVVYFYFNLYVAFFILTFYCFSLFFIFYCVSLFWLFPLYFCLSWWFLCKFWYYLFFFVCLSWYIVVSPFLLFLLQFGSH